MSFEAKFHGACGDCGGHLAPGSLARYEGAGEGRRIVHDVCPDDPAVSLRSSEVVCGSCFVVKPCSCDDERDSSMTEKVSAEDREKAIEVAFEGRVAAAPAVTTEAAVVDALIAAGWRPGGVSARPTREALARAFDPDAFDDDIPKSSHPVAQVQWAARRKLADDAAVRALAADHLWAEQPSDDDAPSTVYDGDPAWADVLSAAESDVAAIEREQLLAGVAELGEFEPTTAEVREAFILGPHSEEGSGGDFDLWLARRDEQVRAEQREKDARIAADCVTAYEGASRPGSANLAGIAAAIRAGGEPADSGAGGAS